MLRPGQPDLPVLVFDKDGVLVDSEPIKLAALEELFTEFPEHFPAIRAFNRANVGMPRQEKLEHFYGQILRVPDVPAKVAECIERSYQHMRGALMQAPAVPGVVEFIRAMPNPKYVCSVAIRAEVEDQLCALDLQANFLGVHAFPERKCEVLRALQERHAAPVIFWGDTQRDREAARVAGVAFVGVQRDTHEAFAPGEVPWITDFIDRDRLLAAMEEALASLR